LTLNIKSFLFIFFIAKSSLDFQKKNGKVEEVPIIEKEKIL